MAIEFLSWLFGVVCGMAFFITLVTVKRDLLATLIMNEVAKDAVRRKKAETEDEEQA